MRLGMMSVVNSEQRMSTSLYFKQTHHLPGCVCNHHSVVSVVLEEKGTDHDA